MFTETFPPNSRRFGSKPENTTSTVDLLQLHLYTCTCTCTHAHISQMTILSESCRRKRSPSGLQSSAQANTFGTIYPQHRHVTITQLQLEFAQPAEQLAESSEVKGR
ncbi:hypothetical protein EYF80_026750 [Liparis tanakae]|uniref:Uncharacterized protein n=1 Tax=Liparis tanakae TaxID=230148 RepID=A0A4Z2HE08_9TELE|nr:hypothetical protein EYF80_026750 [Liparis tanakae]